VESELSERRDRTRTRCLLGAKIEYNNRQSVMDCTIRDHSDGGMRIKLPQAAPLPAEFDLHVVDRGQKHRMRVKWRSGDDIGLVKN
jgi:PilZ domain